MRMTNYLVVSFFFSLSLFLFCFICTKNNLKSVVVIDNAGKNFYAIKESPYFTLGAILTDKSTAHPETRISNYFWLFEEDGYVLIDGEAYYFYVLHRRPNVVIKLSTTPFEFP